MFLTYVLVIISNINLSGGENATNATAATVSEVADGLVALLRGSNTISRREHSLRNKLARINRYVLDKDHYASILLKHADASHLNRTDFFQALQDRDHFLTRNGSTHLYLQMKRKLTRNDVLRILRTRRVKQGKSGRRMRGEVTRRRGEGRGGSLSEVVDKFLAGVSHDNHKFKANYGPYWDPTPELEDRKAKFSGRRIFKGERTLIDYYPFVVSIQILKNFMCSGAIYWLDLILTTSSCLQLLHNNRFYRENPKAVSVRVGSNYSRFGGEVIPAVEVFFHPAYDPKTLANNIAVIRLGRALRMSHHRAPKVIDISHDGRGLATNVEVMILGWGVSKTSQQLSFEPKILQRKILPVFPNKFCKEIFGDKFVTRTMFCAGTMSTGEGACNHDGGGPAILDGKLVGLISYGPAACGSLGVPTALTLVGAYAEWIAAVKDSIPKYYQARQQTTLMTEDPYLQYLLTSTFVPQGFISRPQKIQAVVEEEDDDDIDISDISDSRLMARKKAPKNKRKEHTDLMHSDATIQPLTSKLQKYLEETPVTRSLLNNLKHLTPVPDSLDNFPIEEAAATKSGPKISVQNNIEYGNEELTPPPDENKDVNYELMAPQKVKNNANEEYKTSGHVLKSFTRIDYTEATEVTLKGKSVPGMPPYDDYIQVQNEPHHFQSGLQPNILQARDIKPQQDSPENTVNTKNAKIPNYFTKEYTTTTTRSMLRDDKNDDYHASEDRFTQGFPSNDLEVKDISEKMQDNYVNNPPENKVENQIEGSISDMDAEHKRYFTVKNKKKLVNEVEPIVTNTDQTIFEDNNQQVVQEEDLRINTNTEQTNLQDNKQEPIQENSLEDANTDQTTVSDNNQEINKENDPLESNVDEKISRENKEESLRENISLDGNDVETDGRQAGLSKAVTPKQMRLMKLVASLLANTDTPQALKNTVSDPLQKIEPVQQEPAEYNQDNLEYGNKNEGTIESYKSIAKGDIDVDVDL